MSDIIFISSDYKPLRGGVAEYIDNLARGLIRAGENVRVLAVVGAHDKERIEFLNNYEDWVSPFPIIYDRRPENPLFSRCVNALEIVRYIAPAAMHVLNRTQYFSASAVAVEQLSESISKNKPKVIVFGYLDVDLYPLALFLLEKRLPYGIIAHDVEVYRSGGMINDLVKRPMMLKEASWIVANSRHTKQLLEARGISSSKIKIIHPPISEEAIELSRKRYIVAHKQDYQIVTIARLVKSKGIDTVLRALRILDARGIPFQYVVGGNGPELNNLERLAEDLGLKDKVRFLGYINDDEKWSLLQRSSLFVMPSQVTCDVSHEGFGMAFLEAAAFGIPVVGSRAGGIPEAVLHGETGLLVPEGSAESVAEALGFFYDNPDTGRAMGKTGMERATAEFSPIAIANRFQREILLRENSLSCSEGA